MPDLALLDCWARTGFDSVMPNATAGGGCLVGHLKTTEAQLNAKDKKSEGMSVADADAILMATGYVEKAELATV